MPIHWALLSFLLIADTWPQWRGPTGDSVSLATGVPLRWAERTNVAWKQPMPEGASTPALWGDALGDRQDLVSP